MRIAPDIEVDDAALAAVCGKYGVAELKVFGSRARGTASPGSDIDVLYTLCPGVPARLRLGDRATRG